MLFGKNKGGTKAKSKGTSAKFHKEVGGGSRPTRGKHPIDTSAPMHSHKLDSRHVAGALK